MWTFLEIDGLYWLIGIGLILLLIFLDINIIIKRRHKAFETAKTILVALFVLIGIAEAFIIIYLIGLGAYWIYSNLGFAIFILLFLYILWAVASLLMKYKEKLLLAILGYALTAKIKAFLAGMYLFINTPIGFITISAGSLTWIGLSYPNLSPINQIIAIPLPAYIWTIAGVIFCWGITSMIGSFVNALKLSFFADEKPASRPEPDSEKDPSPGNK
jgi:hypothetical protein